ncbi:MAG: T9SS type A sorting domain-containing protein [Bacteroidales bacterium]|nr:T9SS type A sorting domain-containing protein [Bacteroidales bacterium]
MKFIKSTILLFFMFFVFIPFSQAQNTNSTEEYYHTKKDNITGLPQIFLEESVKGRDLPYAVDNTLSKYFRTPVNQAYMPSCGQASSIGYNFTYEICRLRDLEADSTDNQMAFVFPYSLMNPGDTPNWGYGLSPLESFTFLKSMGCLTLEDYGNELSHGFYWWDNGYDFYYKAMKNRLKQVMAIDISTAEGINTLKNWMYDHLDGSETGGLASFIASAYSSGAMHFSETDPEPNHIFIPWMSSHPNHALTIVAYNDSVRYDYNADGQFTNDVDINGDGIVNVGDWEIGGFKIMDTYGDDAFTEGAYYVMYNSLGNPDPAIGFWNDRVFVIDAYKEYEPQLTYKIELKHSGRGALKFTAGVSSDERAVIPEYEIDFPAFNYNGEFLPMNGKVDGADVAFEFGLDVSELLSHVNSDGDTKFFLKVQEKDEFGAYDGELIRFSLIDYSQNEHEYICSQEHQMIINNGVTSLSVVLDKSESDNPKIISPEYTTVEQMQSEGVQLSVTGGSAPYTWSFDKEFSISILNDSISFLNNEFHEFDENKTIPVALNFDFPFDGQIYDKLYLHKDGFIVFDSLKYPWYYLRRNEALFKEIKTIAPLMNAFFESGNTSEVAWNVSDSTFVVEWITIPAQGTENDAIHFSTCLWKNGEIDFYFHQLNENYYNASVSGVSFGESNVFSRVDLKYGYNDIKDKMIHLSPEMDFQGLIISADGFLSMEGDFTHFNDIVVKVTDKNQISAAKSIKLCKQVLIDYSYKGATHEFPFSNEKVFVSASLKNVTDSILSNVKLILDLSDYKVDLPLQEFLLDELAVGAEIELEDVFEFTGDYGLDEQVILKPNLNIEIDGEVYSKQIEIQLEHFDVQISSISVQDSSNGILEAGDSGTLEFSLLNNNEKSWENISIEIENTNPYLAIHSQEMVMISRLNAMEVKSLKFDVAVNQFFNSTEDIKVNVNLYHENELFKQIGIIVCNGHRIAVVDDTENETNIVEEVLKNHNIDFQFFDDYLFPFEQYKTIFACNVKASSGPDIELVMVDFLSSGGNLYFESKMFYILNQGLDSLYTNQGIELGEFVNTIQSLQGNPNTGFETVFDAPVSLDASWFDLMPLDENCKSLLYDLDSEKSFVLMNENEYGKSITSSVPLKYILSSSNEEDVDDLVMMFFNELHPIPPHIVANFHSNRAGGELGQIIEFVNISSENAINYHWEFEGGSPSSSSEQNPIISYDEFGTYDVKLIVKDGDYSDTLIKSNYITIQKSFGTEKFVKKEPLFSIYPNPTHSEINIQNSSNEDFDDVYLEIFDLSGKCFMRNEFSLKTNFGKRLKIDDLKSGIYLLKIYANDEIRTHKLIVL